LEHIFCPLEIKNQRDEDGTFSGYGSTFGNVDSFGDTVAKGAFKKTIADAKSGVNPWPVLLSQHDQTTPIGILLDMSENEHGLKLKGKLEIKNKRGADIYALLTMRPRPALNGLSIGYVAKDFELHRKGTGPGGALRTLKAVDIKEISVVTFPADKFARVSGVKAGFDDEMAEEPMSMKDFAAMQFEQLRRLMNYRPR
jgi:HK97 family phage prohead protease